ncbi:F0F1 ATP synthase subunit delta [Dialister sp.]|jgi:F-type H+-transporting ATPase subunit delta|uniref:F0F1 ATP synthase subunit delta n=1 Tax=Dialister sp. TaxID=1955814 RepID=UPI0025D8E80E|nr:F0F1 ATP synthase subunit delta [Dialister sp.]MEE3452757.1 F0F1 ATP synthase subunit delta [Dialister sp.]
MDKNVILAKKYGRAIYEVAAEENSLQKTEEDLTFIADTIAKNPELKDFLNHPLIRRDVKKETLKKLFADKVQPIVLQFCFVVLDKDRLGTFPMMVENYVTMAHEGMGMEEAIVTSAFPLSKSSAEALKEKLSEITGKKILLKQKVDQALIGGFTVQVGDRLIDGSVARQLGEMKAQLMQRD